MTSTVSMKKRQFFSNTREKRYRALIKISLAGSNHLDKYLFQFLFSCSVVSDSFWPHGLQHARLPCPSQLLELAQTLFHRVGEAIQPPDPLSYPFTSCPQSFPASGSLPVSQFFTWGGQSIGASASVSVLSMNIQDWFHLGFTGLILQSKGVSRVFYNITVQKHHFFSAQPFFLVQLSHP